MDGYLDGSDVDTCGFVEDGVVLCWRILSSRLDINYLLVSLRYRVSKGFFSNR